MNINDLRLWSILLLFVPAFMQASASTAQVRSWSSVHSLQSRKLSIFQFTASTSEFLDVAHASVSPERCENTRLPEALTTPNPLAATTTEQEKVTVSFIVGTDGKVHSPLILEGGDLDQDRLVLNALMNWRYRPATCNGVPTEMESKVQFSPR